MTSLTEHDSVLMAEAAAHAAGVVIRELSELPDLAAICRLFTGIWQPDPTNPPVTAELARAMTKAGNYASGAYDGGELVGACVGFFGMTPGIALHSHIAGVSPAAAERGVGYALKLHQRAWTLARGVHEIHWTFDPLVRRNAYFNIAKLGAVPAEYLPNFYGGMADGINGDDESDRLLAHWDLTRAPAPAGPTADAADAADAVVALGRDADDGPVPGTMDGHELLVAVPQDIQALRAADPACASRWRFAVRDVLGALLAEGAAVTGFDRAGWYRVSRKDSR